VHTRPYNSALPEAAVLAMMEPMGGSKLDAAAFKALQALVARGAVN
jgi:HD-GYP domain-containing protein (c-di-GMP phosphodiesterase class II)